MLPSSKSPFLSLYSVSISEYLLQCWAHSVLKHNIFRCSFIVFISWLPILPTDRTHFYVLFQIHVKIFSNEDCEGVQGLFKDILLKMIFKDYPRIQGLFQVCGKYNNFRILFHDHICQLPALLGVMTLQPK